jgi:molybdate transport system substrate-binding protein
MAPLKVLCTNAMKAVISDLAPEFEPHIGAGIDFVWASTQMLCDRIAGGDRGDLAILTREVIDDLAAHGRVVPGSRVDLGRSFIGLAVRQGARKPPIDTGEAFQAALLGAASIACSKTGISGIHFQALLDRLAIADAIRPKLKIPVPGDPVGEVVARGDAEIAVQQISELILVRGIEIVGPLPTPFQKESVFSVGRMAEAVQEPGANALVQALTAASAREAYRRNGMEPLF